MSWVSNIGPIDPQYHIRCIQACSVGGAIVLDTVYEHWILAWHFHAVAVLILLYDELENERLRLLAIATIRSARRARQIVKMHFRALTLVMCCGGSVFRLFQVCSVVRRVRNNWMVMRSETTDGETRNWFEISSAFTIEKSLTFLFNVNISLRNVTHLT